MLARFIKSNLGFFVILFVVLALFATNFTPGTYLTGWDNLQTDLNPLLGIKRSIFSVWEEYQSFGLTSGLAHAADLPRSIFIWILSLVLPQNLIRYFYHFLMVFLGGLGIYYLLRRTLRDNSAFAIIGSIFYILNFGTVQILFIPWESFTTFFAFLPWQLLIFSKILENPGNRKDYFLFILINFIAAGEFYIQTIFIVYFLMLFLFGLGRYLEVKSGLVLKKLTFLLLLTILINFFWILPQIYSLLTQSNVVINAKNNLLATENVIYQNLEKGTLIHFIKMEGFYESLYGRSQTPLFLPWKQHFSNLLVSIVYLTISLLSLLGVFLAFVRKSSYRISFLLIFILVTIALLSKFPVFEQINEFLRHGYLINQVFRSTFTKFIIPYSLIASYGLTISISQIHNYFKKGFNASISTTMVIFFALLLIYSFPSFKGNYISNEMRVKIPSAYFEASNYFNNQDKNKRIALLPDYTSLGWFDYRWGYSGSGFLWYAMEQPIVSRTFDVWSNKSEGYYWEEKSALEAEDEIKFQKVLEKYNIDYLLYDKSIVPIVGNTRSIQYDRLDSIIAKSKSLELVKSWGSLAIYKVNHIKKIQNFSSVSSNLPNIGPEASISSEDTAYMDHGDYATDSRKYFDLYYPFLNLTNQTEIYQKYWNIFGTPSQYIFTSVLPFDTKKYFISPKNNSSEFNLYIDGEPTTFVMPLSKTLDKNTLSISFPRVKISKIDLSKGVFNNCSKSIGFASKNSQGESVIIKSVDGGTGCIAYTDDSLSQEYGYLINVKSENVSGQKLFFYILDSTKEQSYLEDMIRKNDENFVIAPRFKYGKGYSFIFHNNSYENIYSENKIGSLDVYLIPYFEIKQTVFKRTDSAIRNSYPQTGFKTDKINYYTYQIAGKDLKNNTLILYQAFDHGWKAYDVKNEGLLSLALPFFFGRELKDHILVNNWANGWNGLSGDTIVIVYLPQYLEYLGFLIFLLALIYLLRLKN